MKKALSLLLSVWLILFSAFVPAFGLDIEASTVPNLLIDRQINRLLSYYFDALSNQPQESFDSICVENNNTLFFKNFVLFDSSAKNLADCKITNYRFNFEYADFEENAETATASVIADFYFTYEYKTTESAMFNIVYDFDFQKVNSTWYISAIDSSFSGFERVKEVARNNPTLSSEELFANELNAVEARLTREDILSLAYQNGTLSQIKVEPEIAPYAASSYRYKPGLAARWALTYAGNLDDDDAYFYYNSGGNCQNFVSQCVWAGYGGAIAGDGDIAQNITNKVRMVSGSSGWYGKKTSVGTSAWASVNSFWNYVTSNPSLGPKGTGYNDGGIYTNLDADTLMEGRILQLRSGLRTEASGRYEHSVIVSSNADSDIMPTQYNKIYICSSTSDLRDVSLQSKMIDYFGGSNCYMRMISLTSSNFNS